MSNREDQEINYGLEKMEAIAAAEGEIARAAAKRNQIAALNEKGRVLKT